MNEKQPTPAKTPSSSEAPAATPTATPAAPAPSDARRWWLSLVAQPLLFVSLLALLIVALGVAQRAGWISSGSAASPSHTVANAEQKNVRYICPMMCTPPQSEPGRCPVCAMELVPAAGGGGETNDQTIQIDPVARRVANIHTATVQAMPVTRTIRAIGELSYDEGTLKVIAAYVDGRLERLYADYTGVVVERGDHLALVYSPRLYSAQVELLLARKAYHASRTSTLPHVVEANRELYEGAKQHLLELGMTEAQIHQIEQSGVANSRMHLCAPISGTVIEKLAVEGQYVSEGQPIYKLADLSTVWLMLKLFPDDAAQIRYGHKVRAQVQSLPGRTFTGRVAFIDPNVDPATRTVGVRVVIPNDNGTLRVGDYAKATIDVPVAANPDGTTTLYDPELASQWIGPRHPHIVQPTPGTCPICGEALVPASHYGFTDRPLESQTTLVVPRSAVLMAGDESVVYVETEPGRFEMRRIVLGPCCGEQIVVLEGLREGEVVATQGNFLIDSQMQLVGNPSLIDPHKASPLQNDDSSAEVLAALSQLPEADRRLAERQRICPVTELPLGSMGLPIKVDVRGTPVFICCEGCRDSLLDEPEKHLARLTNTDDAGPTHSNSSNEAAANAPPIAAPRAMQPMGETTTNLPSIEPPQALNDSSPHQGTGQPEPLPAGGSRRFSGYQQALGQLPPNERQLAEHQRLCPVTRMPLGSMGRPVKVAVRGQTVFLCCEGCRDSLLSNPAKYLARLPKETVR